MVKSILRKKKEIAACAEDVEAMYQMWPQGHQFHELIPGVLATSLLYEAGDASSGEVEKFARAVYKKAGMPGHPHAETFHALANALIGYTES